jgi:acyl-CoA thioesterase I
MKKSKMFIFALTLTIAGLGAAYSASAQVVALGASNTEGHGVGSSEAFPAQLDRMLKAKGSSTDVRNAGVFGDTTTGMLARLSSSVPEGTKIVILQFGGNDFRQGISPATRQANRQYPTATARAWHQNHSSRRVRQGRAQVGTGSE